MKKFFAYLLMFFSIGTIVTVIGLSILDDFIYSLGQTSAVDIAEVNNEENDTIK